MDPVTIRVEPATLQVRTTAMATAPAAAHVLVIGQDDSGAEPKFHASCSCGRWSASSHTERATIEVPHARHAAKRLGASNG